MTRKTGKFARRVVNHQDGRSVHDSPPGFGSTHSILQRRINRKCLVEQSRHVSYQETCVVIGPTTPTRPRQCPNQTVESRINQVNQTPPSISGRRGCGGPGWPTRRGRRGRRFGDGTRGTMVEAHDKRQPVDPETPHYTDDQERQRSGHHQSHSHQERESFHQSRRRYQSSFRSHSRTAQDPGNKVSRESLGKRQRQRQRQRTRSRSGTIETLTRLRRLVPRQKVTTTFGLRQ